MNTTTKIVLTALASLAVIGTANATDRNAQAAPTIEVNAKGIDLNSPQGVARLTATARMAAKHVCFTEQTNDLSAIAAQRNCFRKAFSEASAQIDRLRSNSVNSGSRVAAVQTSELPGRPTN